MHATHNELRAKVLTTDRTKRPTEREKICVNDITKKGLIPSIYKQLMQLNIKNKTTQI